MFKLELIKYRKKYNKLQELCEKASNLFDDAKTDKQKQSAKNKMKEAEKEYADFVEEEYSLFVFNHYSKKEPDLINRYTNEKCSWKQAFGSDFNKISKIVRHSLVGLIENSGKYKFK